MAAGGWPSLISTKKYNPSIGSDLSPWVYIPSKGNGRFIMKRWILLTVVILVIIGPGSLWADQQKKGEPFSILLERQDSITLPLNSSIVITDVYMNCRDGTGFFNAFTISFDRLFASGNITNDIFSFHLTTGFEILSGDTQDTRAVIFYDTNPNINSCADYALMTGMNYTGAPLQINPN
jgi:hypothetical protein